MMSDESQQTIDGRRQATHIAAKGIRLSSFVLRHLTLIPLLALSACGVLSAQQQESVFPSPVAFVTAGPLPEPSATPTLPPVAEPTAIPPTVAPKKLPIDSTAAIGLWSDRIASTESFTGVVDLALGPASLELRKNNLALVSLIGRQVFYGYGSNINDVTADHPAWLLYDRTGKVVYSKTGATEPLLNIREEEVKNQLGDDIAKLVTEGGYEGVLLDGVGAELIRSDTPPVYTGTKTFTEQQRRDSVEGLLRAIRAKVPDKLIIIGGYAWEDGEAYNVKPTDSQELASFGDGVYIDKFLRAPISSTTEFKSETDWKDDIDYLSAISQDNKIVLISTRLAVPDTPTDTIKQWLDYSVASYLLGKNGSHTYFQFDPQGSLAWANDPVLSAPVGVPQEAYNKLDSGIYRRLFANGVVLVNPTGETKETEFESEYRLLGSPDLIKKVSMSPHTGLILLKP
jgi:hypothetical protein